MAIRRVVGYARVSRVGGREGESFQSPPQQRDVIKHFVRARGWRLIETVDELDESGARMDRPKLRRLIERIKQGEIEGVVVARLDRFARNLSGGLEAIAEITQAGGFVTAVDNSVDTSDAGASGAMGRLQLQLLLALAEWERSTRAEGFEVSRAALLSVACISARTSLTATFVPAVARGSSSPRSGRSSLPKRSGLARPVVPSPTWST